MWEWLKSKKLEVQIIGLKTKLNIPQKGKKVRTKIKGLFWNQKTNNTNKLITHSKQQLPNHNEYVYIYVIPPFLNASSSFMVNCDDAPKDHKIAKTQGPIKKENKEEELYVTYKMQNICVCWAFTHPIKCKNFVSKKN